MHESHQLMLITSLMSAAFKASSLSQILINCVSSEFHCSRSSNKNLRLKMKMFREAAKCSEMPTRVSCTDACDVVGLENVPIGMPEFSWSEWEQMIFLT
jgi:hypothetical protein